VGFLYLFFAASQQDYHAAARGLVPHLGGGTLSLTAGIIGATVMPHVVYLHSALHKDRVKTAPKQDRRTLLTWNRRDCVAGLGVAGLINLAMLCVAAALFSGQRLPGSGEPGPVYDRIGSVAGGGAALAFGVALMASGLSSSSVGTYAGQVVMSGFMNWHIPVLARRAVTMAPSLLVLAFAVNTSQALVYSQVVLSFGIPFAIIPLLLITGDRATMTDMTNRRLTRSLMLAVTGVVVALNLSLLGTALASVLR
jgi:manganese transport protein